MYFFFSPLVSLIIFFSAKYYVCNFLLEELGCNLITCIAAEKQRSNKKTTKLLNAHGVSWFDCCCSSGKVPKYTFLLQTKHDDALVSTQVKSKEIKTALAIGMNLWWDVVSKTFISSGRGLNHHYSLLVVGSTEEMSCQRANNNRRFKKRRWDD